jgi:hypothetical protein
MRTGIALLTSIVLVAPAYAVDQPQNREEFKTAVSKGAAFMKVHTHVANRRFEDVAKVLKAKTEECLNVRVTSTGRNSQGRVNYASAKDYHSSFRTVNKGRAELTVQQDPKGTRIGPKMPKGGFYFVALDVDRSSGNTTKLTYYGPSRGWDKTFDAIKKWSDGESAACPKG